jgi:hypothetical protein
MDFTSCAPGSTFDWFDFLHHGAAHHSLQMSDPGLRFVQSDMNGMLLITLQENIHKVLAGGLPSFSDPQAESLSFLHQPHLPVEIHHMVWRSYA